MFNDIANFESATVAAPAEYRRFTFRDLYVRRTYHGLGTNQAVVVNPAGAVDHYDDHGWGATAVHNWAIFDGPNPDARLVARAQGLHIDTTGAGLFYNTFTFVFELGRFQGSTLQAMGVAPKVDDEYSIVGGSGEFALANGVVNKVFYRTEGKTEVDRLTIQGFIPIMKTSNTVGTSVSSFPSKTSVSSALQSLVITKIGPWGGHGATNGDVIVPPHRIERVTIRSGGVIDSFEFTYVDQAGEKHVAGPWGGNGGKKSRIHLGPKEFIKEVSGTVGGFQGSTVVASLKIVTNFQHYGPYGRSEGTAFSVPVQGDNGIMGFFGRGGSYLESIGVYVRP